jgi:hypothetical protein
MGVPAAILCSADHSSAARMLNLFRQFEKRIEKVLPQPKYFPLLLQKTLLPLLSPGLLSKP